MVTCIYEYRNNVAELRFPFKTLLNASQKVRTIGVALYFSRNQKCL